MIIWGYRGYQKNLGQTQSNIECANCHNVAPWDIIETGRKFTLYWIPTFPYGRKHYLTCPVCQHGKQIEKQEIEQFLNYQQQKETILNEPSLFFY